MTISLGIKVTQEAQIRTSTWVKTRYHSTTHLNPHAFCLLLSKAGAFHDEGVPHRCNSLVEKGVLKGFLYDLKTAAQFGVESTGNGSRGLFNPPSPNPTNFILQSGQTPLKDIIAGIDEGIIVEDLLGIGQGNVISGAFSNPLSLAFKIEKGEIVGRVKNVSIAGNVYDLLKNVSAISQESEWFYNTFRAPYVLLDNINVVA